MYLKKNQLPPLLHNTKQDPQNTHTKKIIDMIKHETPLSEQQHQQTMSYISRHLVVPVKMSYLLYHVECRIVLLPYLNCTVDMSE